MTLEVQLLRPVSVVESPGDALVDVSDQIVEVHQLQTLPPRIIAMRHDIIKDS